MAEATEEGKGAPAKTPETTPAPGSAKGNGDVKTLTQDDVNSIIRKERLSYEKQLEAERNERKALQEDFSTWKKFLEDIANEDPANAGQIPPQILDSDPFKELEKELLPPSGIKDTNLWREVAKRQYVQKQTIAQLMNDNKKSAEAIQKLTDTITQETQNRMRAEQDVLNSRKDVAISQALTDNRCIDHNVGLMLFRDKVVYEGGKFLFKKDDGNTVSLEEGISKSIPAYLVRPLTEAGGSGSAGGTAGAPTDQEIATAEADLKTAFETAQKSGGSQNAVLNYQRKQAEVKALKAAKENVKGR